MAGDSATVTTGPWSLATLEDVPKTVRAAEAVDCREVAQHPLTLVLPTPVDTARVPHQPPHDLFPADADSPAREDLAGPQPTVRVLSIPRGRSGSTGATPAKSSFHQRLATSPGSRCRSTRAGSSADSALVCSWRFDVPVVNG